MTIQWNLLFYIFIGSFFIGPLIYLVGLDDSVVLTVYKGVMLGFFFAFALYPFFQGYEFLQQGRRIWAYTFWVLGVFAFIIFGLFAVFLLEGLGAKRRLFKST